MKFYVFGLPGKLLAGPFDKWVSAKLWIRHHLFDANYGTVRQGEFNKKGVFVPKS